MLIWWYAAFFPHPLNSESKAKVHNGRLFQWARLYLLSLFFTFFFFIFLVEAQTTLKMLEFRVSGVVWESQNEKRTSSELFKVCWYFQRQKLSTFPSRLPAKCITSHEQPFLSNFDVHIRNVNPRVSKSSAAHTEYLLGGERDVQFWYLRISSDSFHCETFASSQAWNPISQREILDLVTMREMREFMLAPPTFMWAYVKSMLWALDGERNHRAAHDVMKLRILISI